MILPKIIEISEFGNDQMGYLHVGSYKNGLPFEIKRVFWTFDTPTNISRGRHAHHETEMVLFCLSGAIKVKTICTDGQEFFFTLHGKSNKGLYIPKMVWHEMWYDSIETIQLVATSTHYEESDYIRNFQDFIALSEGGKSA